MICFLALIVCAIIGIFSASHRVIALEAFDCVFRRLTLRRCDSRLDTRLKAAITGKMLRKYPPVGRHLYRHFEVYSWILTIITIASLIYTIIGVGNYIVYGNCNGPTDKFCLFDEFVPQGSDEVSVTEASCPVPGSHNQSLSVPDINDLDIYWWGNESSNVTVIEFGCYTCPFSHQAEPTAEKIRDRYGDNIRFGFIPYPIASHNGSNNAARAVVCAAYQDPAFFWNMHEKLINTDVEDVDESIGPAAVSIGLDMTVFDACMSDDESLDQVGAYVTAGQDAGIYGTPTFFINNQSVVGPKTFTTFKKILSRELYGD